MSAMFDKDEAFAAYVAETRADEYARGSARGAARTLYRMGRKFGMSDDNIINEMVTELNCSRSEAQNIFREVQG